MENDPPLHQQNPQSLEKVIRANILVFKHVGDCHWLLSVCPAEYVAMYTYESNEQGDLSFQQGDIVMVTRKEGDWWTGVVGNKTGVFPSNYVKPRDSVTEVRPNIAQIAFMGLQWAEWYTKLILSAVIGASREDGQPGKETRWFLIYFSFITFFYSSTFLSLIILP